MKADYEKCKNCQISVGGTERASLLGEPKYIVKLEMKSEELVGVPWRGISGLS